MFRIEPVAHGDDEVALDADGARRRGVRRLAGLNAIGPPGKRGELTAVVGVVAFVLTLFRGVIDKPGAPADQISVEFGWGLALAGTLLMIAGAVWRSQESAPRRKPPGVL